MIFQQIYHLMTLVVNHRMWPCVNTIIINIIVNFVISVHFRFSFYSFIIISFVICLFTPTADFSNCSTDVGVGVAFLQFRTVKNAHAWKSELPHMIISVVCNTHFFYHVSIGPCNDGYSLNN